MNVYSIVNQKGGIGKTTTAINLAHWFALKGERVLLIDLDAQGHAGTALGVDKGEGVYKMCVSDREIAEVAIPIRENLHLVQSNKRTNRVKTFYATEADLEVRYFFLDEKIREVDGMYDHVFLDMAPGSEILQLAGLAASDYFIVPTVMDPLAIDSVAEIISTALSLNKLYEDIVPPKLIGALPTMYERVTRETTRMLNLLTEIVGRTYVLPPIAEDTSIREASEAGLSIWEYNPSGRAAIGYEANGAKFVNSLGRVGGYLHTAEYICNLLEIPIETD